MGIEGERAGKALLGATGLLLIYAVARVLQPLVPVLGASAIFAVVFHPLYMRLLSRLPGRPNAASAVAVASVCLLIAVPLAVGGWFVVREALNAYPVVKEQVQALTGPAAALPSWVPPRARAYLLDMNVSNLLLENIQEIGAWSGGLFRSTAGNVASLVLNALVFVLCLFLFLRDGAGVTTRLLKVVPLAAKAKEKIVSRTHDMIIAAVQGIFVVAVVQGLLSIVGFSLFAVPFPLLLGFLCMLLSPIPFVGTMVVWVPVVARIALDGQIGRAALVALWFALVVGTADNILRPLLIGSRARVPAAIVIVGVIGGVRAFGAMGTFLGPVIMAIAVVVVDTILLSSPHERS